MQQSANTVLLIKPAAFSYNAATAASNTFQHEPVNENERSIQEKALEEFEVLAQALRSNGIQVLIYEDTATPLKPDAVFPNNWISFHEDGTVILYPMLSETRRTERRQDILEDLRKRFHVREIIDLTHYEEQNRSLEGTGSIVFDHKNKTAYACISPRTDQELFIKLAEELGYKPVWFHSVDEHRQAIYHTNVMMCIAEQFAVICTDSIQDEEEKNKVMNSLVETGHRLIFILHAQMNCFAGNMLALKTKDHKNLLVLSQSAFDSLSQDQKTELEQYCGLLPLSIPTIESIGGGSTRCMIAEVFLQKK